MGVDCMVYLLHIGRRLDSVTAAIRKPWLRYYDTRFFECLRSLISEFQKAYFQCKCRGAFCCLEALVGLCCWGHIQDQGCIFNIHHCGIHSKWSKTYVCSIHVLRES